MENIYWNKKGKHQTEMDRLSELMPSDGKAITVAGELIRAVSKLGYDLYNNGMGNNTSGAVNFLKAKGAINLATHATVAEHTRGSHYPGNYKGDDYQVAMESLIDQTIEHIITNPALKVTANTEDMFDYEDDFDEDEDEDEYEYGY